MNDDSYIPKEFDGPHAPTEFVDSYKPEEYYEIDNSTDWPIWRFIPAALLMFFGAQVTYIVVSNLIQLVISPVERGPLAPPMYVTVLGVGSMLFFGVVWVVAAIAIAWGKTDLGSIIAFAGFIALLLMFAVLWLNGRSNAHLPLNFEPHSKRSVFVAEC